MAGETSRTNQGNKLADLISPGANSLTLSSVLRDAAKIVVLTQVQYDALATKDSSTIYIISG